MARRKPPRPGALTELQPLKIISQIALLQLIYYAAGTVLILFTVLVAGRTFSLDLVLSWRSLRGDTTQGWMLGLVWMIDSFIGAIAILFYIQRSKLVPDFALTVHFLHLLTTSLYSHSFPRNLLWWALQFASASLMTSLGMWSCRYRELKPIMFGGSAVRATAQTGGTADEMEGLVEESNEHDPEAGGGRAGRRGKGREALEMVTMGKENT